MTAPRRQSLRRILILGSGLSILVPALVFAWFQATTQYDADVVLRGREPLRQYTEILATAMGLALWDMDRDMAAGLVDAVMRNPDVAGITIQDEFGELLTQKLRPVPGTEERLREEREITHNGRTMGRLTVELSLVRVKADVLRDLALQGLALLVQVTLSFLIVRSLLNRRLIRPLRALQEGVSRISGGDFHQALSASRPDELGRLTEDLDSMRRSLAALIDERRLNETALKGQTAQLRALLDTLPDLVWLKSTEGVYLTCNQRFEQLFGAKADQIIGRTDYDFVEPALADFFRANDRKAMEAGKPTVNEEVVTFASDGHKEHLETVKTPITGPDGEVFGVLGIGRDITGRIRAEEDKIRLQAQLLQSQKMESLGLLAGGVAHDMNNVLGAILVSASTQREVQPPGSPARKAFDAITRAAERGGKVVGRLLSLSHQGPAQESDIDLNAMIGEETALFRQTTLAKVRIETDLDPELKPIRGDENALNTAVMNLCVNAFDAMSGNGTLTLRTRNLPGETVEVRIEDTGTGMPPEVLDKAFDPFFTTKPMGKGTGLGLSMVYSTVKAHGGQVSLDSAPGRGTVVTMTFPASGHPPAGPLPAPVTASGEPGPALRILLVDDDELIRETLGEILRLQGHQVAEAESGEAALTLLGQDHTPDLVILDLNMPGLGGAATLPRLRELRPGVPVLLSTGKPDQAVTDLTARYDRVSLLPKPFDMEELQGRLRTFLAP